MVPADWSSQDCNTYGDGKGYDAGATTINQGVLQADRGVGLSPNSGLILNGGVLQSNSAVTYADGFWNDVGETPTASPGTAAVSPAGGGKMTVNIDGDGMTTLNFGNGDGRNGIMGNMILSSNSAQYETEIQNAARSQRRCADHPGR